MDTPVLSNPAEVVERRITLMAGGRREDFDRAKALLDAVADNVVYTGGLGTASVCKLINNMTYMAMMQVMAETLTLGLKAGVELDAIKQETGQSERLFSRTVFRGQFQPPTFTLALSLKDVALATELGRESSVPMPLANMVEQIMRHCVNKGWAEDDSTKQVLWQEEAAGVEIQVFWIRIVDLLPASCRWLLAVLN